MIVPGERDMVVLVEGKQEMEQAKAESHLIIIVTE